MESNGIATLTTNEITAINAQSIAKSIAGRFVEAATAFPPRRDVAVQSRGPISSLCRPFGKFLCDINATGQGSHRSSRQSWSNPLLLVQPLSPYRKSDH